MGCVLTQNGGSTMCLNFALAEPSSVLFPKMFEHFNNVSVLHACPKTRRPFVGHLRAILGHLPYHHRAGMDTPALPLPKQGVKKKQ